MPLSYTVMSSWSKISGMLMNRPGKFCWFWNFVELHQFVMDTKPAFLVIIVLMWWCSLMLITWTLLKGCIQILQFFESKCMLLLSAFKQLIKRLSWQELELNHLKCNLTLRTSCMSLIRSIIIEYSNLWISSILFTMYWKSCMFFCMYIHEI